LHAPTTMYSLREFLLAIAWLPAATCVYLRARYETKEQFLSKS
jgi:hypothetical protein